MLTIAVFPNEQKTESHFILDRILSFFSNKDVRVILAENTACFFDRAEYGVSNIEHEPADLALSIGGDGTLLGVCRRYSHSPVPVCGINIGTLGFMADIETNELEMKLQKILDGAYYIEHRLLLSGSIVSAQGERFLGHAINDIVVTKGGVARMLRLDLSISNTHLMECKADGIIVSTPTGSTAYSLSAGGPIMNPNVRALLVTPICAHTFNFRPFVIGENESVLIQIAAVQQDIIVTFDGQESYRLLSDESIKVQKSDAQANIVKFEDKNYYQLLKTKLWKNS